MMRVQGDDVCVDSGEIVVFVDAKDVTKEAVVVRGGLAPCVRDVLHFARECAGFSFQCFVVAAGRMSVHSGECVCYDGLVDSCFRLLGGGRHDSFFG